MPSLFLRLQRYARTPGRNASEDRLTEALGTTLDAAPEAARFLVREFFDVEPSAEPTTRAQIYVRHVGRIDLELCFGNQGKPELLVWFENKVDAKADAEQGRRYIRELEKRGCDWTFSWLIPTGKQVVGGLPAHATMHTWQELGATLRRWLQDQRSGSEEIGPWIVSQFLHHLESEEKLAFIEPFAEDDAKTLEHYEVAQGRLRQLLEQTKEIISDEWPPRPKSWWPERSRRRDFFLVFDPARQGEVSPWPERCWFEWHGRPDGARETPEERWVIGAGVTFPANLAPLENDFPSLFDDLRRHDFEIGQGGLGNEFTYIFRYIAYGELAKLESDGLGGQARALADWVTSAFDTLNGLELPEGLSESDSASAQS